MSTPNEEPVVTNERKFADAIQSIWAAHNVKMVEEFKKLASELNLEVSFEMRLDFDIIDNPRQNTNLKWYHDMLNHPRVFKVKGINHGNT